MDDKTKMTRTTHIFHQPVHFSFALALLLSQPPKVPQNVKPEFCMCFTDLWVREKRNFQVWPRNDPQEKRAQRVQRATLCLSHLRSRVLILDQDRARAIFQRRWALNIFLQKVFFAQHNNRGFDISPLCLFAVQLSKLATANQINWTRERRDRVTPFFFKVSA